MVGHPNDTFKKLMPQEYADVLYPPIQEVNWHFQIDREGEETFYMSYLEAEREINDDPDAVIYERKYYAPMK